MKKKNCLENHRGSINMKNTQSLRISQNYLYKCDHQYMMTKSIDSNIVRSCTKTIDSKPINNYNQNSY